MAAGGRLAAAPQSDMIKQLDICSFNLSANILSLPDLFIIIKKQATMIQEIMITTEEPPRRCCEGKSNLCLHQTLGFVSLIIAGLRSIMNSEEGVGFSPVKDRLFPLLSPSPDAVRGCSFRPPLFLE